MISHVLSSSVSDFCIDNSSTILICCVDTEHDGNYIYSDEYILWYFIGKLHLYE